MDRSGINLMLCCTHQVLHRCKPARRLHPEAADHCPFSLVAERRLVCVINACRCCSCGLLLLLFLRPRT